MKKENYLKIFTDGGAINNPGPGAIGVIIKIKKGEKNNKEKKENNKTLFSEDDQFLVEKFSKKIGNSTNNQAEYQAIIFALEKVKQLKNIVLSKLIIDLFSDSQLVVNQLNLKYKIKDKDLGTLFIKVWNLSQSFKKINFIQIPREENKEADKLVKNEMKQIKKEGNR